MWKEGIAHLALRGAKRTSIEENEKKKNFLRIPVQRAIILTRFIFFPFFFFCLFVHILTENVDLVKIGQRSNVPSSFSKLT